MNSYKSRSDKDLYRKLKWLAFFRGFFAAVLFGSVLLVLFRSPPNLKQIAEPLLWLCIVSVIMLFVSIGYGILLSHVRHLVLFAYIQIGIDTVFISLLVFFTGCFVSVFSFLYLVVIVYACMILYQQGGMITSTLCAIEYGLMIDFEYYGLIRPPGFDPNFLMANYDWNYVVYRLIITISACYLVAFLSGFLAGQEKRAKQDLWSMAEQVKRVEKLASIGEMAAGMAHEIKNPLASLTGSIQMLIRNIPYDPMHDKLMKIILRETDRLTLLVSEFLIFAKPVAGNPVTTALHTATAEVLDLFTADPKCSGKVQIIREFHNAMFVMIDPEHFRQIVWNLLNNAIQAVDMDGIIKISIYPIKKNKNYACITVADNGCGIENENLNTVFDPFFSTKKTGTGLGLSIVQQLVSLYDGFIDIESEKGKGTEVTIRFPKVYPGKPSIRRHLPNHHNDATINS